MALQKYKELINKQTMGKTKIKNYQMQLNENRKFWPQLFENQKMDKS